MKLKAPWLPVRPRFRAVRVKPLTLLLGMAGLCTCALAQKQVQALEQAPAPEQFQKQPQEKPLDMSSPEVPPVKLKNSRLLLESLPGEVRSVLPTFLSGDLVTGRPELDTTIDGHAELRRADTIIRADRMDYYQPGDLAKARGNVHLNRRGNVYEGEALELKVESFEGFFNQPRYRFLKNGAYGEASRADFFDSQHAIIQNATYSTCQRRPGPSWMPDWILHATSLDIDEENDVGVAKNAVMTFKGVTSPALPSVSFPLGDNRKSGLLPPVLGLDSVSGIQYAQSYYWDLAPNRDATLAANVMSKRGVQLGSEFRYLEPTYRGVAKLDLMPYDRLRQTDRWGAAWVHNGILDTGIPGVGGVGLAVNLNRVSDDNYWRDFPRSSTALTQRLLPTDVNMTWGRGDFSGAFRTLKWQTLQDPLSPIVPPYDRLPQLTGRYTRANLSGFDVALEGDATKFSANPGLTLQPNAARVYSKAQVSYPWQTPGWFATPKVQLHTTAYQFDQPLANGNNTATRAVPTFSLDSGVVLEREASYLGRHFVQTLEPRAFYVYTPYRNQSLIPKYDTGAADFNFATIYTENAYIGNDRISDNNLLTLGVTSRLLDPDTGAEALRLGFAQRLRFKDQRVTLNATDAPDVNRLSDQLFGISMNWTPQWTLDSTLQYNPKDRTSDRATIGARYNPGRYRTVSAAYRYQTGISEQVNVGWQWPLNDLWGDKGKDLGSGRGQGEGRWYSVGRLNYSLYDHKMVDTLVGFEYDAGCWLGRAVLSRLQTGASTNGVAAGITPGNASTSISFQLEFVGFSRVGVGTSPMRLFKQNVPRFEYLREPQATPSHFSNYD